MRTSDKSMFIIFAIFAFLFLQMAFFPEGIPDWESYRTIYDTDGAWLKGSGDSTVFLFIMNTFKSFSPVPTYEAFRITLLFGFGVFTWLFLSGRIIDYPRERIWMVLAAFILIGALRFTGQIREGLMVVLFLTSLGFLQRSAAVYSEKMVNVSRTARRHALSSWAFAILAIGAHTSGAILFLTRIFALILHNHSRSSKSLLFGLVWLALGFIIFSVVFGGDLTNEITALALSRSGTRDLDAGFFTIASAAYWAANIAMWRWLDTQRKKTSDNSGLISENVKVIVALISGPLAALSLVIIFSLKSIGTSPIVTVLFVRAFDLMEGITLLYIALFSRSKAGFFVVVSFTALKTYLQF